MVEVHRLRLLDLSDRIVWAARAKDPTVLLFKIARELAELAGEDNGN